MPRSRVIAALGVAAAALTVFALVPPCGNPPDQALPHPSSGGLVPHLVIYRKHGAIAQRLPAGATVHAGDTVQVTYIAAGMRHGVVVSVDGLGTATQHFPVPPRRSTQLRPRGQHPLDHAFALDDAPDLERFFFVTSAREPIDPDLVVDATEALTRGGVHQLASDDLDLPEGLSQWSVVLKKGVHK